MDCPTPDVIAAFLTGRLTPEEIARIEAHVGACTNCLDLFATVMRAPSSGSEAASAESPSTVPRPQPILRSTAPLPLGSTAGRYLILSLLGRGGMGDVYAAYDPELDRRVAVKLLATEPARVSSSEARARLLREAKAIARLSHPNVVVVHDAGVLDERVFIAMELVEGETLSSWLKSKPRDWRMIRDVFVEAGKGLAAAHAAGLVHRDFKPQNVMVGRDGKVRVTDFGLVRELGATVDQPVEDRAALLAAAGATAVAGDHEAVNSSLTRTGTLIGTPTYMAPEQFLAQVADVRTDQFSFCVALYEGLYGQRPFSGQGVVGLREAVLRGDVRNPSDSKGVPTWLRRVILRGLEPQRDARYPSMEALLHALRRDPARRTRRLVAAGLAAIALVGIGIGSARLAQRNERLCRNAADKLTGVWETFDDQTRASRRNAVRHAILATKLPLAAQTWERIASGLDQYANRWTAAYTDACEATHLRGEQSAQALDLRMACLGERLGGLKALTDTFMTADAVTVIGAVDAAGALVGLERCANVQVLRSMVPPPTDPKTRARVDTLRARLASVKALRDVGHAKEALTAGGPLVDEARTTGYRPLIAEALTLMGWLQDDLADEVAAGRSLNEAYLAAEIGRDDETRADAAVQLVGVVAALARPDEAEHWVQISQAILERLGGGHERLVAWLLTNRGVLSSSAGDFRASLDLDQQALVLKERVLGPDSPDVALTLDNIGTDLTELGEHDRAVVFADRALAVTRRAYGDAHPRVAHVMSNRGEILNNLHRYDEARASFLGALERWQAALFGEHRYIAYALTGIGETEIESGRPNAAVAPLERGLRIREQQEPDVIPLAQVRFALARALWESNGDRSRARLLATRARDAYRALPRLSSKLKEVDTWLASHSATGRLDLARAAGEVAHVRRIDASR